MSVQPFVSHTTSSSFDVQFCLCNLRRHICSCSHPCFRSTSILYVFPVSTATIRPQPDTCHLICFSRCSPSSVNSQGMRASSRVAILLLAIAFGRQPIEYGELTESARSHEYAAFCEKSTVTPPLPTHFYFFRFSVCLCRFHPDTVGGFALLGLPILSFYIELPR